MRDKLRNEDYFREYIKFQEERTERFTLIMKKIIEQRGINDPAVNNVRIDILGFKINKLFAMYSYSLSLEEIKGFLYEIIEHMESIKEVSYYYCLIIISISVLLEVNKNNAEKLIKVMQKLNHHDYLMDFMLNQIDSSWKIKNKNYMFNPYMKLDEVIKSADNEISIKELACYLENDWYEGHDDMGWYDTHKIKDDFIYSGYWSFESGAIAKILGLDDSSLKDTPYYPYDMVHYQDK